MTKFNERIKKAVDKLISEMLVEPSDLNSYHYERNPYGVEDALIGTSSTYEWDEDEYFCAQAQKTYDAIMKDGLDNYIDLLDEDYDNVMEDDCHTLQDEVLKYVESLTE